MSLNAAVNPDPDPDDNDESDDDTDDGGGGGGGGGGGEPDADDLDDLDDQDDDDLAATNIPPGCPPPGNFCPQVSWWQNQHGSIAVHQSGGKYYLPNGAYITSTQANYNSAGTIEGYLYGDSSGDSWWAGSNYTNFPENDSVFDANYNALYDAAWRQDCGHA